VVVVADLDMYGTCAQTCARQLVDNAVHVVQELRTQNMAAIKVARRQHKATCSDADGYDLITVPEVSACGKFVIADGPCAGCPD